MDHFLTETPMLDFSHSDIQKLIREMEWTSLDEVQRVSEIYRFVRDDILFGYNVSDTIPASQVLADGYGQCNTKATLFMALLRGTGIPCRIHGFTIHKKLQKGAQTGLVFLLSPKEIVHSWAEVYCNGQWWDTEGIILDCYYLSAVQTRFADCAAGFCGYGVAVDDLSAPTVDWNLNNTYIQRNGIVQDFGVFDSPDEFFSAHPQKMSPVKRLMYEALGRKLMNRNVSKLRTENQTL